MKKLIALVLALAMVLTLGLAFADSTITINRDASWDAAGEAKNATYTYHKVFDATITTAAGVDLSTGMLTGNGNVVYTVATEALANAVNGTSTLEAKIGADSKYYISKKEGATDAGILADIKSLVENNAILFPGTSVTSDANPVVLTVPSDGYYYIEASNGKDAIVQTIGSVTINEKNDYPTIDKKQKKANGDYADTVLPQEIGSYVDYEVTVHIPTDATKQIAVIDTMTAGLEYDSTNGLTLTPNIAYEALTSADNGYNANAAWQIKFTAATVEANRGATIKITYRAKVTAAALTDSGKENEVTLNYDNGNYILKDDTDYETYFAGIYKVDPNDASANMAGVKFVLKTGDIPVNVTYVADGDYYVVDPTSSSNEVVTRADSSNYTIKIRGLDNDKAYTLTETETVGGYNLLNGTVALTKIKDEGTAFANKPGNTYDRVENQKGTQLPSTGGIGTTIFYILGGILIVGAAIILVARRKAHD